MEISDVRVKLINDGNDRLKAVCTVTFDEQFVVRDVKVVDGTSGLFVAMPSRKVSVHCPKCGYKNAVRSRFCNDCGGKLPPSQPVEEENGRSRLHRDIAHPITTPFREMLQSSVLKAYEAEVASPGQPARDAEPRQHHVPHDDNDDDVDAPVNVPDTDREGDGDDDTGEVVSEYDAIIAGLRSGGGRGPSRRESAPSGNRDRSDSRPRRDERGRGQGSERRDDRPARPADRASRPGDRPAERSSDAKPPRRDDRPARPPQRSGSGESRPPRVEPAPRPAVTEVRAVSVDDSVEGFGAGIMDTGAPAAKRAATARPPVPARKPEPPPPPPVADDDDGAFGEGIL